MNKKKNIYAMTRIKGQICSFLIQEQKAVEIHCDQGETGAALGNIYIGKIKNIAKNINAAFVEIAPGENCYLALDEVKNPTYTKKGSSKLPQAGDELLVQISREGIKTKLPSVTTNLTLHGKYALLTTGNTQCSVSSKLSKEVKERLLVFVQKQEHVMMQQQEYERADQAENRPDITETDVPDSARRFGWLMRTNAGEADEALLAHDMNRLYAQYEALMQQAQFRTCFSCMRRTPSAYLTRLSDLYDSSAEQIITDDAALYEEIRSYLSEMQPEDLGRLVFYEDQLLPMKKLYSLEHQLDEALREKVWLNCGGYLVIQPTEALTVIDVNSGKMEAGKKKEAAFLKVNKEAAVELARQIRLRNISGIIIVDFINMETAESKNTLLALLDAELKKDPIRTVLIDMTKLSLVEITRMKREKSLAEQIK